MPEVTLYVPDNVRLGRERVAMTESQALATIDLLEERLASLEFAMEDEGWQLLNAGGEREFSREGLRKIINRSRLMYLSNPLIRRGVDVQANYVFGQGVEFAAEDPAVNEVVQAFIDDPKNRAEFASHQAMTLKEIDLALEANLFFVYFTDPAKGTVRVRSIIVDEIQEIITNPEDAKEPWFYRRVWVERRLERGDFRDVQREALYPDWQYNPRRKTPTYSRKDVVWDQPVQHVKTGGLSSMRFGVPEVYPALDWAKAYKEQLEDDATRSRALARFAMKLTVQGNAASMASAKERMESTFAPGQERNPASVTGSTFIGRRDKDGNRVADIEPMKIEGALMPPDHSRPFRLMVAAAMGLPETFFGDADVGNHATSKTLDRPTELMMTQRRELWADVYSGMFNFVVRKAVQAPGGALRGRYRVTGNGDTEPWVVTGVVREAGQVVDATVRVTWPPLLEHDVAETVKAVVAAATLDGKTAAPIMGVQTVARMLLTALGVKDIDEKIELWFGDEKDALPEPPEPVVAPLPNEEFTEAVHEMREALRGIA